MSSVEIITFALLAAMGVALWSVVQLQKSLVKRQAQFLNGQANFQAEVQRQLAAIQTEFLLAREQRQFVLPPRLSELQEVEAWVTDALQLATQYKGLGNKGLKVRGLWENGYAPIVEARARWFDRFNHCYTTSYRLSQRDVSKSVTPGEPIGPNRPKTHFLDQVPADLVDCIQRLLVCISLCDIASNNDLNINVMDFSFGLVEKNVRFATTELVRIREELVTSRSKLSPQ